jgi:hypothetical protein
MGRFKLIALKSGQKSGGSPGAAWVLGLLASLSLAPAAQAMASNPVQSTGLTHPTGQTASYTLSQSLSWGDIVDWLSRRKVPGTSRGDSLCLVSPNFNEPVWSLQPSVFWQGEISAMGLRRVGDERPLWKQATTSHPSGLNRLRYTGRLLQPGQDYEWMFFATAESTEPIRVVRFKVMAAADRAQVRSALLKLGGSGEARAQARAVYFSQQELSADTLAEMVAVPQPSPQLQEILGKIAKQACQ